MVFLGLFPMAADEYQESRGGNGETTVIRQCIYFSSDFVFGVRQWFSLRILGLLHAEVVQERILREFDLTMLATAPSVEYRVTFKKGVDYHKLGFTENHVVLPNNPLVYARGGTTRGKRSHGHHSIRK